VAGKQVASTVTERTVWVGYRNEDELEFNSPVACEDHKYFYLNRNGKPDSPHKTPSSPYGYPAIMHIDNDYCQCDYFKDGVHTFSSISEEFGKFYKELMIVDLTK
jgi:hypothetical protein